MAFSKEDLQALEAVFDPIRKDMLEMKREIMGLKQGQAKLEQGQAKLEQGQASLEQGQASLKQGQAKLEQGQAKLEQGQKRLEKKMDEGFGFLKECINEAAVDIGRTSKSLRDHMELPIH